MGLLVELRLSLHLLLSRLTFGFGRFGFSFLLSSGLSDLLFPFFLGGLSGLLCLLGDLLLLDQLHSCLRLDDLLDLDALCESALNFVFVRLVESEARIAVLLDVVEWVRGQLLQADLEKPGVSVVRVSALDALPEILAGGSLRLVES